MIEGAVHGQSDAIVELAVLGPDGAKERLDFRIDTGFDGALTLHSAAVAALGLSQTGTKWVRLADGRTVVCDVCDAHVEWDGALRPVGVQIADIGSLLGMALLGGHRLWMDVVDGGVVRISPLMTPEP
jgi:clan AA aspartic protease